MARIRSYKKNCKNCGLDFYGEYLSEYCTPRCKSAFNAMKRKLKFGINESILRQNYRFLEKYFVGESRFGKIDAYLLNGPHFNLKYTTGMSFLAEKECIRWIWDIGYWISSRQGKVFLIKK